MMRQGFAAPKSVRDHDSVFERANAHRQCCQIVIGLTAASAGRCGENKLARGRKKLQSGVRNARHASRENCTDWALFFGAHVHRLKPLPIFGGINVESASREDALHDPVVRAELVSGVHHGFLRHVGIGMVPIAVIHSSILSSRRGSCDGKTMSNR